MSFRVNLFKTLKKQYKEKDFSFLVLTLSLFLLPVSINLSTFSLVISIVLKFVQVVFLNHKLYVQKSLKISSYIGLIFFLYVILSSIIQNNIQYTLNVFDKEFSHLTLLFLAPMLLRKKEDNKLLSYGLILGLITACIYVFAMSYVLEIDFNKLTFLKVINIHHTYLSIYILFFVNIILASVLKNNQLKLNRKTSLFLSTLIFAFIILFMLGSKISMVIYLFFIGVYTVTFLSKKRRLIILTILPILIVSFLFFNKKIDTSYKSALNFRLEIWNESINSIKENPFFGNLKMSEKDVLNYHHYISGKYYLMDSDLNSHNQFLSILLKYGIVGSIILLFLMVNIFKTKNFTTSKDTIANLIGFLVIMFGTFYIENVLDRHHGVVFFSIFFNYYLVTIEDETK